MHSVTSACVSARSQSKKRVKCQENSRHASNYSRSGFCVGEISIPVTSMLQSLHASVTAKLVKWPSQNKPAYAKLIHDLIVQVNFTMLVITEHDLRNVQGLSKLHDSEVMVVCRACDKQIVETAIGQIKGLADFSHCNITVHPTSSLSADRCVLFFPAPPPSSVGSASPHTQACLST